MNKRLKNSLAKLTLAGEQFYGNSRMYDELTKRKNKNAVAIVAKSGKRIVGWSLVVPFMKYKRIDIYVSKSARRRGIGGKLLLKSHVLFSDLKSRTNSWNEISKSFYINVTK